MSPVKRNIIANFMGQGWAALMSIAFVPLYIKFLGIEAFGLIGFYAMLQIAFQMLDLGLSQTMNREMARYSAMPEKAGEARDFVRTLEVGYWAIGIVIGVGLTAAAPLIAGHWIKAGTIPVKTVQQAVMIMGAVSALQWPLSFYDGGLMGLQKQVLSNTIKISTSTLGSCGAGFILWKISPTITAFFVWQIFVSALALCLYTVFLWRSLPPAEGSPRFNPSLLRSIWRFAAGMGGITIFAIILSQLDKVILSKLLSLEMFGYYVLAGTVCNVVPNMLVGPVFNALFPKFSALVAQGDEIELTRLYHQGTQLMTVIVVPVALVLAFFSYDVLLLWTRSVKTAGEAAPIVSILIFGMMLNAIMNLPYALQLSHGWTSIGLRITLFLIITLVPAIIYMTMHYGAIGAASVWVCLNAIYMLIGAPLTHRRLLKHELSHWAIKDIGIPVLAALVVTSMGRWMVSSPMAPMRTIMTVGIVLLIALSAASLTATHIRAWIFMKLFRTGAAHA